MFTVCYLDNPIMKTNFKYLLLSISLIWIIFTLELLEAELYIIVGIGFSFGLLFLILSLLKVKDFVLDIFYEIFSVFAAIGWISIFSGIIIDFISFLSYYFSLNEIILNSILLSAGNTVGDFFGNASLAKAGSEVMGAFASYSGQLFNNYVGFGLIILFGAFTGNTKFDLFAQDYYQEMGNEDQSIKIPPPYPNYFLITVLVVATIIIITKIIYFFGNNFVLNKKLTYILIPLYCGFLAASCVFGMLAST